MEHNGNYTEYVRRSLDERLSALEVRVQEYGVNRRGVESEVQYVKKLARTARKEAIGVEKDLVGFEKRIDVLEGSISEL